VDIYAPGEAFTLGPDATTAPASVDGASFAAPIVSGVLAMMWNANPCMTNEAHVQALLDTADSIRTPSGDTIRRVNAYAAVKRLTRWAGRADHIPAIIESIVRKFQEGRWQGRPGS